MTGLLWPHRRVHASFVLNHYEWTCSKRVRLWLSKRGTAFIGITEAQPDLYSAESSAECGGVEILNTEIAVPAPGGLVNRRSAGVWCDAAKQQTCEVTTPRGWGGKLTPPPRAHIPSILLNVTWCCSSTPRSSQRQRTANGLHKRNTLSCMKHTVERRKQGIKKSFKKAYLKEWREGELLLHCAFSFSLFSKQTSYTQSKLSCVPLRSAPIIALPLPQS